MSEKILFVNRGDLFTLKFTPILASKAEKGVLEAYLLKETDVLYFAIMPPTGTFEDALLLQAYTATDMNPDNSFTIKIDRKNTCLLPAGIYYYTIKLATGVTDPAAAVFDENTDMTTILGRTKLIVSDGSLKATSGKFMTGMVPTEDETPEQQPDPTPDVLFETYEEAELYAKTAANGKLVSVRDDKDPDNIRVYIAVDGLLNFVASTKNPGSGSSGGGNSGTTPSESVNYWLLITPVELSPEDFKYAEALKLVYTKVNGEDVTATEISLSGNSFTTTDQDGYIYFISKKSGLFFTCGGFNAGIVQQPGTIPDTDLILYKSNQIQLADNLRITVS